MGKEFVAVKTINPNYIGDFNTFKKVRLTSSSKRLSPVLYLMGSCRNCALVQLCGNECDIQMLSASLDLALDSPLFCLVCPWMPNGMLYEYLHEHPDVDKFSLVRFISGTARDF